MTNTYMLRSKLLRKMNINTEEIGLVVKDLIVYCTTFEKQTYKEMEERLLNHLEVLNEKNHYSPYVYRETKLIIKDCILMCELETEFASRRAEYVNSF